MIEFEFCDTPEKYALGLQFRESLPDERVLAFNNPGGARRRSAWPQRSWRPSPKAPSTPSGSDRISRACGSTIPAGSA
jgi:hypothetical protein